MKKTFFLKLRRKSHFIFVLYIRKFAWLYYINGTFIHYLCEEHYESIYIYMQSGVGPYVKKKVYQKENQLILYWILNE